MIALTVCGVRVHTLLLFIMSNSCYLEKPL